jgi:hypothetical protein
MINEKGNEMSKSLYDLMDEVNDLVIDYADNMDCVTADKAGLDPRCGSIWIGEDCIAVKGSYGKRMIEYYGGFEYVNKDEVSALGEFTFYSIEDSRVAGHIEHYLESKEEEELAA